MSDQPIGAREFDAVPCPFCGLLCDDLRIAVSERATAVVAKGCARSRELFGAGPDDAETALVDGNPATFDAAATRAATILKNARRPLLISAGTDVAGMRVLLELAERTGGIVDHSNGDALFRNLLVLQDSGWMATTLTEVRNRADLLVVASADIGSHFPRFFERLYGEFESLFETGGREVVFLGALPKNWPAPLKPRTTVIPLESVRFAEVFAALRALHAGRDLRAKTIAGIPTKNLAELIERMRRARYGVLTWAAAELDFPHAEVAIQSMCEFVRELNESGRFSVLPLGGTDGDLTAVQVTTWQTGFPLRVSFTGGKPGYDPWRNSAKQMLERNEADALVYVSALDAKRTPPKVTIPSIVLGRPGMRIEGCEVFIPVATPGIHHTGHLYRSDNVVAIRLHKLADSPLPSAAHALNRILETMKAGS